VLHRANNLGIVDPNVNKGTVDDVELSSQYSHSHWYDPDESLPRLKCPARAAALVVTYM
jgi:hypothetical protein